MFLSLHIKGKKNNASYSQKSLPAAAVKLNYSWEHSLLYQRFKHWIFWAHYYGWLYSTWIESNRSALQSHCLNSALPGENENQKKQSPSPQSPFANGHCQWKFIFASLHPRFSPIVPSSRFWSTAAFLRPMEENFLKLIKAIIIAVMNSLNCLLSNAELECTRNFIQKKGDWLPCIFRCSHYWRNDSLSSAGFKWSFAACIEAAVSWGLSNLTLKWVQGQGPAWTRKNLSSLKYTIQLSVHVQVWRSIAVALTGLRNPPWGGNLLPAG